MIDDHTPFSRPTNPFVTGPDRSRRVVTLGQTGLERRLRRDRSIDLCRAASPIEAIAELAEPSDDAGAVRTVVIYRAQTLPDARDRSRFANAARSIDATITIVGIGPEFDQQAVRSDALDGVLGEDATADELFAIGPEAIDPEAAGPEAGGPEAEGLGPDELGVLTATTTNGRTTGDHNHEPTRQAGHRAGQQTGQETGQETGQATGRVPASAPDGTGFGDAEIVAAVLDGVDAGHAATGVLSSRLGIPLRFVANGSDAAGETHTVPVERDGRTLGVLCVPEGAESFVTASAASWLAGWVSLGTQHANLRRAAFTDPLTGAFNRRYFDRFLASAIEDARKSRLAITLLLFDIDGFKTFNDQYGHAAGDEILVETVRLLQSVVRPNDRVCRIGGDEFVVVFYEPGGPRDPASKPPESVQQIAARFQAQVREQRFPKLGLDAPGSLGISGGLATFPWDGHDAEHLLRRADELAMKAKAQGKNCITFGPGAVTLDS